jgi:hypothetical protein
MKNEFLVVSLESKVMPQGFSSLVVEIQVGWISMIRGTLSRDFLPSVFSSNNLS